MSETWRGFLLRISGLVLFCALLGWSVGQTWIGLGLGVLLALIWCTYDLRRLQQWLQVGFAPPPNDVGPVWDEIYQSIYRARLRAKKRKRKLSRILDQFQEAVAAFPDAVVVLNRHAQVLWCNDAAFRLLGLHPERDVGLPITTLVRHPDFVKFLAHWQEGGSVEFPAPNSADRILRSRVIPYGKKRRLMLMSDVSETRRLERVRSDFVANASHELRTPLTVIIGYLETLTDSADPCAEQWRQPLSGMRQQAERMQHIIEDLLMLSRLEAEARPRQQAPVAVPVLLEAIAEEARALSASREHEVYLEVDPNLGIMGAEQELRSAFSNLIFNAIQHTPAKTRVMVRWFANASGIHLEVEDHGEGIPEHHLARLSERFYRVERGRQRKDGGGGTGLGLAIVKHVLQRHDAEIRIASTVGVGSTFTCDFPSERKIAWAPRDVPAEHVE